MPKDTKSSGYNKAPACESRGFGHKKEGENFDTPSNLHLRFKFVNTIMDFKKTTIIPSCFLCTT